MNLSMLQEMLSRVVMVLSRLSKKQDTMKTLHMQTMETMRSWLQCDPRKEHDLHLMLQV